MMKSENCATLLHNTSLISEWSKQLDGEVSFPVIVKEDKKFCTADVTNALPSALRNRLYREMGPICYSLPLFLAKIIPEPFIVYADDMKSWLNSPFCRRLSSDEKLEAGDIGTIGFAKDRIDHVFTYISRKLNFETDAVTVWRAVSLDKILVGYRINVNCLHRYKNSEDCDPENFEDRVTFYRCQIRRAHLNKPIFNPNPEYTL